MGIIKHFTTYCPPPPPPPPPPGGFPFDADWEDHPSWITGMQALGEFHEWVARVVLPIAFEWIEDHKTQVYENIPKDLHDDVGVVITAAYELVKQNDAFKRGEGLRRKLEEARQQNELDAKTLNPVWTRITQGVKKATREAFEAEKKYLDDTI